MAEIVITEFMDEDVVREAFAGRDVLYDPKLVDQPDALARALPDARALIVRNRTQVRTPLLEHAPRLRVVGRLGVGLDNIDVQACEARSIAVRPATGANDAAVAEYVITAAFLLLRRAWFASAEMLAGGWPRTKLMGHEIAGKRLGLIGFGAIARETAARARALGMHVLAFDPHLPEEHAAWAQAERADFARVLETSDVVSLHIPLTEQTRHLVDGQALARMRPSALLINAARGGVVEELALAAALREGRLGGAALDVFEIEPLDAAAAVRFSNVPNLILTPHIAGVTVESNVRVSTVTALAVLACL